MSKVIKFYDTKKDALPFFIPIGANQISISVIGNSQNDVELTWDNGVVETFPENGNTLHNPKVRYSQSAVLTASTYTRILVRVEK